MSDSERREIDWANIRAQARSTCGPDSAGSEKLNEILTKNLTRSDLASKHEDARANDGANPANPSSDKVSKSD